VARHLRAVLVTNKVLPQRDEQLSATEQFLDRALTGITSDSDPGSFSPPPPGRSYAAFG
jgi:hypothetical protein